MGDIGRGACRMQKLPGPIRALFLVVAALRIIDRVVEPDGQGDFIRPFRQMPHAIEPRQALGHVPGVVMVPSGLGVCPQQVRSRVWFIVQAQCVYAQDKLFFIQRHRRGYSTAVSGRFEFRELAFPFGISAGKIALQP